MLMTHQKEGLMGHQVKHYYASSTILNGARVLDT